MIILPIEFLLYQGHTKFGVSGTDMARASWPFFFISRKVLVGLCEPGKKLRTGRDGDVQEDATRQ